MPQRHSTELRSCQRPRGCYLIPATFAFSIYHLSLVHQVELLLFHETDTSQFHIKISHRRVQLFK